ncbi:MAG: sigma-54-dependent Fis family transcriptional regulator [Desulfobacterales bacterium]|nr:sigma-54-dependent Fis family transcriptional regulator [Desulfobacterales bacterium]
MPPKPERTLVVIDDDRLLCDTVRHGLIGLGVRVLTAHSGAEGLRLCAERPVDVVLLDQKLPDGDGISFCGPLLERNESAKIIFITAFPSFENAVQAIKVGAYDYLSKPFELGELSLTVNQALRTIDLEHVAQVQQYQGRRDSDRSVLWGGLPEVRRLVGLAAANAAPVLITGQTGTGKTLVAKAIHFQGHGADKAFIAVNCAAIPENLMEAELFGYEKGAFTGAVATVKGLFEMADGGTLFLDEIGEMPLHLQSKLLGALDDQQIRRLGGRTLKAVHARIITATNTDLATAVRERRFREDLYYRLSVMHIAVPPLRERLEDLPELCRGFISQIAPDQVLRLEAEELAALGAYAWPGNVRELRNIIERAILVRSSNSIYPSRLLGPALHADQPPNPTVAAAGPRPLEAVEREHIRATLCHFNGNQTHAAKALGISRSTLVRKLKRLGFSD